MQVYAKLKFKKARKYGLSGAEKEGFEPSRRYKRPTPFPGEPLRPAWVLLQFHIFSCLPKEFSKN